MTDYFAHLSSDVVPFRRDAERMRDKIPTDARFEAGVMRWNSNNAIPPADIVAFAAKLGYPVDVAACDAARSAALRAFAADYKAARAKRTPAEVAEERAMARAAHGPGVELMDVLTGERYRT